MLQQNDPGRRSSAGTVLEHAFGTGAFTASEVMEATGLTRSTVLAACEDLVERGWLVQLDDARIAGEYRLGRPARRWQLDTDAGVVVGVDVGHHRVTARVASLRGLTLAQAEVVLDGGRDGAERRGAVADAVAAAVGQAGVTTDRVLAAAVGVPAPVDARGASPAEDDGFWHSMNPGFDGVLPPAVVVVVENDANLAAVAEHAAGGGTSFAALLAGERFGSGLVVDGVLLRGTRGGAGEMRMLGLVAGVGTPEGIGAAARTLAAEAIAAGRVAPETPLGRAAAHGIVDAKALFGAAEAGDAVAVALVERLGERLAAVCVVLASVLDIERVIVAGAIAEPAAVVIARANEVLQAGPYAPVPVVEASRLGVDVVVVGAVQRALGTVRADPLGFALTGAPRGDRAAGPVGARAAVPSV